MSIFHRTKPTDHDNMLHRSVKSDNKLKTPKPRAPVQSAPDLSQDLTQDYPDSGASFQPLCRMMARMDSAAFFNSDQPFGIQKPISNHGSIASLNSTLNN